MGQLLRRGAISVNSTSVQQRWDYRRRKQNVSFPPLRLVEKVPLQAPINAVMH